MQKRSSRSIVFVSLATLISVIVCCSPFLPSLSDSPGQIEQNIFSLINDHRRSISLNDLGWSDIIAEQARLYSQSMADGTVPFGHEGFDGRVTVIARSIPWQSVGEVLALVPTAAAAVDGWIASPDHKPFLEGVFDLTGIGVAIAKSGTSFYATEIFIRLR